MRYGTRAPSWLPAARHGQELAWSSSDLISTTVSEVHCSCQNRRNLPICMRCSSRSSLNVRELNPWVLDASLGQASTCSLEQPYPNM